MVDLFLTGDVGQSTASPTARTPTVPNWDGSMAGLQRVMDAVVNTINNINRGGGGGGGAQQLNFVEVSRSSETVSIKDDSGNSVGSYQQITFLRFRDAKTGSVLTWSL
jgi:hypothetical protein